MKNIIISDKKELSKKLKLFKKENVHILSDFDRTLTRYFVKGKVAPTVIAQIREGGYLTEDYPKRAYALHDKYYPIEIDPNIDREEKIELMNEWWNSHFRLLVECGLNKEVMNKIASKKKIQFRRGFSGFINLLKKNDIPLIIMSAGPSYMITRHLEQEKILDDNVYVIANEYNFDKDGKVTGIKEPIIHSLNKNEFVLKDFKFYDKIKDKKNVILLGDNLDDVGMIEGFDYDVLIKIGFLNDKTEELIENYKKNYDVVILNDGSLSYVNGLLKKIFRD